MAHYVDGFVVPVPKNKMSEYKKIASVAATVWKEHGALDYWECVGDDVPMGKLTSFPRSVQTRKDETVVFSWIVYKSRAHRDAVNKKVMEDKRMQPFMTPDGVPFDGKRMIYGGFKSIVER